MVDTLGLLVANRVEPADTSDRRAGALLLDGLSALFPRIRTVIADAGHESRKLARTLKQHQGWQLRIVKRRQRAFKITGLTWIVERSFAWLGRNRRLSKDYEYRVQTSETMKQKTHHTCEDAGSKSRKPLCQILWRGEWDFNGLTPTSTPARDFQSIGCRRFLARWTMALWFRGPTEPGDSCP